MKPWMLGNVLALFEAAQAGYMPALSVEAYLTRIAKQSGKPVLELESIEQQFELFEGASFATQVAFLEDAVKAVETRNARREINRITQAWETSDQAALERLLGEMRAQSTPGRRFNRRYDPAGSASGHGAQDREPDGGGPHPLVCGRFIASARAGRSRCDAPCARLHRDRVVRRPCR